MYVLILTMVVAAFAAARLARLIAEDEITVSFRRAVINQFGPSAGITKLIHCAPWCMSMWFSVLVPVSVFWHNQWVLAAFSIPAGSMAAAMILRLADRE
jgi:hypothetical protein